MKLVTSDDFARFAKEEIPKLAEIYSFIKTAEDSLQVGAEHVFYNGARRFGFQSMIILAAIKTTDTSTEWKKKISVTSQFVDLILTSRMIEGKENNYDNLKEISFDITQDIRDKDSSSLIEYVCKEWSKYAPAIANVDKLRYAKSDRSDMLYILARIGVFLEEQLSLKTKTGFSVYWQRDKGSKTYDIEHLLRANFDPSSLPVAHGFSDAKDYAESRNLFGALTLLTRTRNRSQQDKPYKDKLSAYATESILTQTFCEGLYKSKSNVSKFFSDHPTVIVSNINDFCKGDITIRGNFYKEIAKLIWSPP